MKSCLVTGGAGFIGSNLAIKLKKKYPELKIICLDNLIRKGSELNVPRLRESGIEFIKGDVRFSKDLDFDNIDLIIECSAEPSVLAGIDGSAKYVLDTNLIGAINCLELAKKCKSRFIFLSTSRVYPYDRLNKIKYVENETRFEFSEEFDGLGLNGINENFPIDGVRSFYGASKLCAELLIKEYSESYGISAIINRCGVISGPWQMGKVDQGVFSLWVARHFFEKNLSYIGFGGKGKQVRDLVHIDDLFELIDTQIQSIKKYHGDIFNVGGGIETSLSLLETTRLCEKITGKKIKIDSVKEDRPVDIPIYITDNSKVTKEFGWSPKKSSEIILNDIYNWIKTNRDDLKGVLL